MNDEAKNELMMTFYKILIRSRPTHPCKHSNRRPGVNGFPREMRPRYATGNAHEPNAAGSRSIPYAAHRPAPSSPAAATDGA